MMSGKAGRLERSWSAVFDYSRSHRLLILTAAGIAIVLIACIDLLFVHELPLGFLYFIPLIAMAGFLDRWQVVLLAFTCAVLREAGRPLAWSDDYLGRITTVAVAFAGAALFVRELARNQQLALQRLQELRTRQQLEQQLRHAQRLEAVGRLAGGIAHHFNNLLAVIIGFSDLAAGGLNSTSTVRRDIEQVRRAAMRAAELTRQLLEFSRNQSLQPGITDLNTLVANLANLLRPLVADSIELHLVLQPGLQPVNVDTDAIEQVIMNLVMNARDAMPNGGKLTIETAELQIDRSAPTGPPGLATGRYVTLTVRDTGLGMGRDVQEHMFEPFFTTKGIGKGTGLGLSIVYGIVKQHSGDISFDSKPGEGTTFTVYLPSAEATSN